jgi:hypothetical protein
MIVTRHRSALGNSALADNARDRPRAAGCAEHIDMRKQLLADTNSCSLVEPILRDHRGGRQTAPPSWYVVGANWGAIIG